MTFNTYTITRPNGSEEVVIHGIKDGKKGRYKIKTRIVSCDGRRLHQIVDDMNTAMNEIVEELS